MKYFYKVVFELIDGDKTWCFFESTNISVLMTFLSDNNFDVGYICEIKRIKRLPKNMLSDKGYCFNRF